MELWIGIGVVFVLMLVFLWRARRGTTGPESRVQGLPDDLRDKNSGQNSLPNRGRPWGRGN
jgi:hypothetical protein